MGSSWCGRAERYEELRQKQARREVGPPRSEGRAAGAQGKARHEVRHCIVTLPCMGKTVCSASSSCFPRVERQEETERQLWRLQGQRDAELLQQICGQAEYWQRLAHDFPDEDWAVRHALLLRRLVGTLTALRDARLLRMTAREADFLRCLAYGLPVHERESEAFGVRVARSPSIPTASCARCRRLFSQNDARIFARLPCNHYVCPECCEVVFRTKELAGGGCPACGFRAGTSTASLFSPTPPSSSDSA
mmetsp:Transcript_66775/g.169280  ORF Transcript_66775/g.169280 Transcript_66775/m.169280 type:complete len:249 (-) Transcript_66775:74-820(-)